MQTKDRTLGTSFIPSHAKLPPEHFSDEQWRSGYLCQELNLKAQLTKRASSNKPMLNFSLPNAQLESINLVNRTSKSGYVLTHGDFYRANFHNAHCFKLDLSGSSLMKADFSGANLHCANLTGCNLLGTNFDGAKLDHVIWGDRVIQEHQAQKAQTVEEQIDYYQQAEEIYRNLRLATESQGLFEIAGSFFQREMTMRRKQMPRYSIKRALSKIVDLFCGYGEQPLRVVTFTWAVIFAFAVMFFFSGLQYSGQPIAFDLSQNLLNNFEAFISCGYFSIVTFTTLGYGDITPVSTLSRILASAEALFGSFTLALFVVVFVKKMTR